MSKGLCLSFRNSNYKVIFKIFTQVDKDYFPSPQVISTKYKFFHK